MLDFLFKRNLWSLDLASSLIFAILFGAITQDFSDSGPMQSDRIFIMAIVSAFAYLAAFMLKFPLRNLVIFRSWMWMGYVGALMTSVVQTFMACVSSLHFPERLSLISLLFAFSIAIGFLWTFAEWAILGCGFILMFRLASYPFSGNRGESRDSEY